MKKKCKLEYICLGIIMGITIVFLFLLNYVVGYYNDDLWYSTNLVTGETLQNFSDIVASQVWHYNNWGGRTMAHAFLQLTFLAGPTAINIINLICTVFLAFILCKESGRVINKTGAWLTLFALSLFVSCNANMKETLLWQSGVANYLYMGIFQMIFLWIFLRCLDESKNQNAWWIPILTILVSIVAGWSNENMGPALWVGSIMVIIFCLKKYKKIKWWMIIGNIECLIGSILMIIAPGNSIRAEEAENALYDSRLYRQVIYRFYWVSKGVFEYLFPVLIVTLFLLFIYCIILKMRLQKEDIVILTVGILATGAMLLSPHFPDRATFGILIIFVTESVYLVRRIINEKGISMWYIKIGIIFFWLAAMYRFSERFLYEIGVLKF